VKSSYILLATARVIIQGGNGQKAEFRALLDSGSQINAISKRAIKMLSLKTTNAMLKINGTGGKSQTSNARINVQLKSKQGDFSSRLEAMVLPHIVADQPTYTILTDNWKIPKYITFADPQFGKPGKVDILLGAEHYCNIMQAECMSLRNGLPKLQNTKLGWIVAGKISERAPTSSVCAVLTEGEKVDEQLAKFWELDNFQPETKCYSPMHKGPTVQSSLMSILLQFRVHKYVFTADIEKMYRQIWINPNDQQYQMIVWRYDPSEGLKFYRLKTVTYGTKSAPYLATKCLEYLASKNMQKYHIGSSALKSYFYVDDCITGADTIPEALQIQKELNHLLLSSGFKLRKWCPSSSRIG